MYSVFLVDDEPIVLEGIRTKVDWEGAGFTFAGEATDGEIALSMIHEIKPDILITDIKMPFMDGLQLAAAIKKIQPWIKIIILSGHDEFDYAKKAISIGIDDYILKPFTSEEIESALKKAAGAIDKERKQLSDISILKEELKSQEKLIRKEFLNNITNDTIFLLYKIKTDLKLIGDTFLLKLEYLNKNLSNKYMDLVSRHLKSYLEKIKEN